MSSSSEASTMPQPGVWTRGQVAFVDWQRYPWTAQLAYGITGDVMVTDTKSSLGFDMSGGGHANWIAFVRGPNSVIAVPGCKVNTITYGDEPVLNPDFLSVP